MVSQENIGDFECVKPLGQKGNAEIWVARTKNGELVTLHTTPILASNEKTAKEELAKSLALAKQIQNTNIVRVLDGGIISGKRVIVSEFVDGVLLSQAVGLAKQRNKGWPSCWLAGFIVHQVGRALAYLHQLRDQTTDEPLGLVYREMTPMSIILERSGGVKIFEMAATHFSQKTLETAGHKIQSGLLGYSSPELADSSAVDAKSDIFSLGVVFWELLARRPLFTQSSDLATLEAVKRAVVPVLPDCPSELADIVSLCLKKNPDERWRSATALSAALAQTILGKVDAGPSAASELVENFLNSQKPKKANKTNFRKDLNQTKFEGSNSNNSSPPNDSDTPLSDPPAFTPVGNAPSQPDPFFDEERDAKFLSARYDIISELGSGGMSEVYKVMDKDLNEVIALKVMKKAISDIQSVRALERLKRELKIARGIVSKHVCRVHDFVNLPNGLNGITMEFIEGETLESYMSREVEVNYRRVARWAADIADGLAAAHEFKILHRDLKPANIMIREVDDRAVILDLGIARSWSGEDVASQDASSKLTVKGVIMGTPIYMSPEQLGNKPLDGRSDLYSLGLILAELATQQHTPPFCGDPEGPNYRTYAGILDDRVLKARPFKVHEVAPNVPRPIADIIEGLLIPLDDDRTCSAAEVRDRLEAFLDHPDTEPKEEANLDALPIVSTKIDRFNPQRFVLPLAIVVTLLIGLAIYLFQIDRPAKTKTELSSGASSLSFDGGVAVEAVTLDSGVHPDAAVPDAGTPDSGKKKKKRRKKRPKDDELPPAIEM